MYQLGSERLTAEQVMARVGPVVWARARRAGAGRADDFAQDVFAALFADGGRVLRGWVPARGTLNAYVGSIAAHVIASTQRSGRRGGWREDPADGAAIDEAMGGCDGGSGRHDARDLLRRLLARLPAALTPRGLELFTLLFVEEASVAEVASATGLEAGAIYTWRSRLTRTVCGLAGALASSSHVQ